LFRKLVLKRKQETRETTENRFQI